LSYEYRPDSEKYKREDGSYDRSKNIYKVRASVTLLDMGSICFKSDAERSGSYIASITGSNQFDLSALNTDIDQIKDAFDANPALFMPTGTNTSNYKVSLPAAMMAEVDYYLNKGFYVNLATHLSLSSNSDLCKMNT
jgi:Family of unknown function (DUF5723)